MSDSDNEAVMVSYGTPLEPLEEDEIPTKKPCLIEDQIVTDKQGRRRFHGAFTGGFSAGFYNTVGTLEGWKPSFFKSSKSEKQQVLQQKPEDFMDEEDFDEFGIAPLVLKAKINYTNNPQKTTNFFSHPNLGKYVLKDLLRPARETLGIKLLKEMGWRPGQGVGPWLTKSEKKKSLKIQEKIYGCQLPSGFLKQQDSESDSDTDLQNIKFAPNDYELFFHKPKDNFFGIGYEGLDKRPILGCNNKTEYPFKETNRKIRTSSQAFGVGAFEEEDEDIYLKDDMSHYDFSLGNENQCEEATKAPLNDNDCLEGFILEIKKYRKNHYPLPLLPKNFKPRLEIFDIMVSQPSHSIRNKPSRWSKNDEDQASSTEKTCKKLQSEVMIQDKVLTEELISNVSVPMTHFKPFANIPEKQERYEKYLKLVKIKKADCLKSLQPVGMTEWDKEREKVEFEKAAALFKPLSGDMEDRFLTASQPDDICDPLAVVEKFRDENDDRKKAAKINMFGTLTRRVEDWIPCSLLCKRFNIPDSKKSNVRVSEEKPAKYHLFDCLINIPTPKETIQEKMPKENEPKILKKKTSENSVSMEKLLDPSQEKIDLFKAVFLDSDDEHEEEMGKNVSEEKQETELLYEEKVLNFKRNTELASGIFENIDLESLNKKRKLSSEDSDKFIGTVGTNTTDDLRKSEDLNLIYGPKIPEGVGFRFAAVRVQNVADDDDWVEKKSFHKKNKKEKKHKHKSKHKHKKSKK